MADAFGPDGGQKVDAAGNVTYDFDGHVLARGLDLLAGTTSSPPVDRRVRWLRESDGALVADVSAYESGGGGAGGLTTARTTGPGATWTTGAQSGDTGAAIVTQANQDGGTAEVYVLVGDPSGGFLRTIIDQDGNSDFLQVSDGPFQPLGAYIQNESPGPSSPALSWEDPYFIVYVDGIEVLSIDCRNPSFPRSI